MHIKEVENMFWGVTLDGGKRYTQTVERSFHLSMAALEPSKEKGSDTSVSVMIQHEKAEFMLCTLQQGKLYQQPLDLNFTEGEEVTFFLSNNKGVVHLTGFLVEDDQYPDDFDPLYEPSSDEDDDDSDEDEVPALIGGEDDSEDESPTVGKKRKKQKQKEAVKKKKIKVLDSEEDDDDDEDEDDDDDFADFIDDEAIEDSDEDDDEEDDEEEETMTKLKKKQNKEQKKKETPKKKQESMKGKVNNEQQTPKPAEEGQSEGKKKKKKKKKKNKDGNEQTETSNTPKPQQQQPKKQVLTGGVVSEDTKVGHGPVAKPGQMAHVYYTGRLQKTGKQFDSCTSGKPFRFRLGKGEVIKGWDSGVSGMKVGGKRKLTIPSQQAYGNTRQGSIPAGSTLVFEVELKAVS